VLKPATISRSAVRYYAVQLWLSVGTGAEGNYVRWREWPMPEAKSSRHSGEEWTQDEVQQLRDLAAGNTPVGVMTVRLAVPPPSTSASI
jgi:hypothetical protein